jgi:hypothetical protein
MSIFIFEILIIGLCGNRCGQAAEREVRNSIGPAPKITSQKCRVSRSATGPDHEMAFDMCEIKTKMGNLALPHCCLLLNPKFATIQEKYSLPDFAVLECVLPRRPSQIGYTDKGMAAWTGAEVGIGQVRLLLFRSWNLPGEQRPLHGSSELFAQLA